MPVARYSDLMGLRCTQRIFKSIFFILGPFGLTSSGLFHNFSICNLFSQPHHHGIRTFTGSGLWGTVACRRGGGGAQELAGESPEASLGLLAHQPERVSPPSPLSLPREEEISSHAPKAQGSCVATWTSRYLHLAWTLCG